MPKGRRWPLWRLWNGHPEYHRRRDLYGRNQQPKPRRFPNQPIVEHNARRAKNNVTHFDIVQTTIPRYESGDLLAVFDQLNTNAFTDGRVRLFSFHTATTRRSTPSVSWRHSTRDVHFFEDDAFGVWSASEWITFPSWAQVRFLVTFIVPTLFTSMIFEFTRRTKTTGFTYAQAIGQCLRSDSSANDLPILDR